MKRWASGRSAGKGGGLPAVGLRPPLVRPRPAAPPDPRAVRGAGPPVASRARERGFDGLRGLAALAVVFSHVAALSYVSWEGRAPNPVEFALWHFGAPAVDLFFVLSGLVVTRSLLGRPAVPAYLARRLARLLPVAYVAVLLGFLARAVALHAPEGMSVLVAHDLRVALTPADRLGMLTLSFPALNANALNPPLWTLIVELQVALAMPLFAKLARRWWVLVPGALLCVVLSRSGWPQAVFFPLFLLGALLAPITPRISAGAARAMLVAGLAALLQRFVTGSDEVFTRYLAAPGAALVLLAVQAGAGRRLLEAPPVQCLGRISYALYASHFPILLAVAVPLGRAGVNVILAGLAAVPLCLLVAWAVHRGIEAPVARSAARWRERAG